MGNYTVDEHYISRFIIKNFADEHGKVRVINKSKQPIEPYSSLPEKLFFSCNLYETKNNDGTYFDRNAIEKGFSDFERRLSAELPQIIKRADENKKLNRYQIKCLAELVAFQLVRLPFIRKLFFESNDNITDQTERTLQTNAMYRIVIDSPESAFSYLENNEFPLSEDAKNNIRETKANTTIYDFINNECNVYLIKAEKDAFCIGDFPVLIDAFTNAKYIFPVSPRFAIVCALTEPDDTEEYDTIRYIKANNVLSCSNFTREQECKTICLFDFDGEGYSKFKKAKDLKQESAKVYGSKKGTVRTGLYVKHNQINKYALLIPIPERLEQYISEKTSTDCFIEVETLIAEDYLKTNPKAELRSKALPFYKMKDNHKNDFWKDLLCVDRDCFIDFEPLFTQVESLFNCEEVNPE